MNSKWDNYLWNAISDAMSCLSGGLDVILEMPPPPIRVVIRFIGDGGLPQHPSLIRQFAIKLRQMKRWQRIAVSQRIFQKFVSRAFSWVWRDAFKRDYIDSKTWLELSTSVQITARIDARMKLNFPRNWCWTHVTTQCLLWNQIDEVI